MSGKENKSNQIKKKKSPKLWTLEINTSNVSREPIINTQAIALEAHTSIKSSMSNQSQAVTKNQEKKLLIKEQRLIIISKHKMLVEVSFRPPTITGPRL